jgi:alpha-1,3/alpha-1,6-mannosyltransferase
VVENREHLEELQLHCKALGLNYQTVFLGQSNAFTASADVTFMPSISDDQKNYLLHASTCLLYTPSFEHFGIVPVEAMYCGLPVVSVNNGGPKETVVNGQTGYLCEPTAKAFGSAILKLVTDEAVRFQLSTAAKQRVLDRFEFAAFATKLNGIVTAVHEKPWQ